jgi:hypothetical protein
MWCVRCGFGIAHWLAWLLISVVLAVLLAKLAALMCLCGTTSGPSSCSWDGCRHTRFGAGRETGAVADLCLVCCAGRWYWNAGAGGRLQAQCAGYSMGFGPRTVLIGISTPLPKTALYSSSNYAWCICCLPCWLQVQLWSRLGRLKRSNFPKMTGGGHTFGGGAAPGLMSVLAGRLLCDTYLSGVLQQPAGSSSLMVCEDGCCACVDCTQLLWLYANAWVLLWWSLCVPCDELCRRPAACSHTTMLLGVAP